MEDSLQYPIGQFDWSQPITLEQRNQWMTDIENTPTSLKSALSGLTAEQLDTPYRPAGWSVRQVAHHLPDSHMNSYIRFKLALTEEKPTIKPYMEDRWATLADSRDTPIETSLVLLSALHERWVILLKSMLCEDFQHSFTHPESGLVTLEQAIGLYAWHGRHHIAQIISLRQRMNW